MLYVKRTTFQGYDSLQQLHTQHLLRKIKDYLEEVCQLDDPAVRGHGLTGPWAGFHRYRLGQIRIIVSIERAVVTIIKIDRRDAVY